MELNSKEIASIVESVIKSLDGGANAPKASGPIPKTSRVAMLLSLIHI